MSMPITEHFSLGEAACKDHDRTPYPAEWISSRLVPLYETGEVIRYACGDKRVHVISLYRTLEHNTAVGGEPDSFHMRGMAMDFSIDGVPADLVHMTILRLYRAGKLPSLGGVGRYSSFVHIDIRDRGSDNHLARWRGKQVI